MKKLMIILSLLLFSVFTFAQERTVYLNGGSASTGDGYGTILKIDKEKKYRITYTGTAADTLKDTNQDTIAFVLQVAFLEPEQRTAPHHIAAFLNAKGLTGTDTTVVIESDYKICDRSSWAELTDDVTSSVHTTAAITTEITTLANEVDFTCTQTVASHTLTFAADTSYADASASHGASDSVFYKARVATEAQQTFTISEVRNKVLYWRILRFMVIIQGDDSVGTGIEIEEFELFIY